MAFVDGTVLPIFDPTDILAHRKSYNVKHDTTALTYFIVVTPRGRIMYCSKVGSHEAEIYCIKKRQRTETEKNAARGPSVEPKEFLTKQGGATHSFFNSVSL